MKTRLAFLLMLLSSSLAHADADDEVFYRHAAHCVALFKRDALALQPEARAGHAAAKAQMVQLTAWGFGFIGTAYKRGLRNPRADALLAESERALGDWDAAKRQEVTEQCQADARAIFANASGLERAVVNNRAAARVDKQLKAP